MKMNNFYKARLGNMALDYKRRNNLSRNFFEIYPFVSLCIFFLCDSSHPKRWQISSIANYTTMSYSPSCYDHASQVFGFSFDTDFVKYDLFSLIDLIFFIRNSFFSHVFKRQAHPFINRLKQSSNPYPYFRKNCLVDAEIMSQHSPYVMEAAVSAPFSIEYTNTNNYEIIMIMLLYFE